MSHFGKIGKPVHLRIAVMTMILTGSISLSSSIFAHEYGNYSGKHRRSGISTSFKLTTTTGIARAVTIRKNYVNHEFVAIQEEAAKGEGVHLVALAYLLEEPDTEAFSRWMQTHYQVLFTDLEHPEDLLARVQTYRSTGVL